MIYLKESANRSLFVFIGLLIIFSCSGNKELTKENSFSDVPEIRIPHLIVLGIAQDAGYPQADCKKSCCTEVWTDISKRKMVSCIGIRNPRTGKAWLIDATPDIKDQLQQLQNTAEKDFELAGVFLTHAHMGHYTGLMHFGREAMGAKNIPVYVLPKMEGYLRNNGPWSQLVELNNISLRRIHDKEPIEVDEDIKITPFLVPHRDEFSETVGYFIETELKKVLFIPDIDKWEKWDEDILKVIKDVDVALLDGSFYRNGEIWGRDMSEIPHPFIEESMALFSGLPIKERSKIHFIHLNHTNPLLREDSQESKEFRTSGMRVAVEKMILGLSE